MYYKIENNGIIAMIGKATIIAKTAEEITKEKYNQLMATIQNKPDDTLETAYYLSAETETYAGRNTTHDEKVDWYVSAVTSNQMTVEEVPDEFKAEVEAKLPQLEPAKYTLDEAANLIAQEVSRNQIITEVNT